MAFGVEDYYPFVHPIDHVYVPVSVHRYIRRVIQIVGIDPDVLDQSMFIGRAAVGGNAGDPSGPKGKQVCAVRAKFLDPMIVPVGNVDIAVVVNGDAPGHVQLAGCAAFDAEPADVLAILAELLDAAVHRVDRPKVVIGIERKPRAALKMSGAFTFLSPRAQQVAVIVKDGDPILPFVRSVDVLIPVQGQAG